MSYVVLLAYQEMSYIVLLPYITLAASFLMVLLRSSRARPSPRTTAVRTGYMREYGHTWGGRRIDEYRVIVQGFIIE